MSRRAKREGGVFLRRVRSVTFAHWLREVRRQQQMSQGEAAEAAGLNQQDWSKMESKGMVPRGEILGAICQGLNHPLSEALSAIHESIATDEDVLEIQARYHMYKQLTIEREQKSGAVGIFVVREDPVEADYIAAGEYADLLVRTENTWITLLFRLPDPKSWRSFYPLIDAIAQQLKVLDKAAALRRIRAFYRQPEYAEQLEASLPLVHPYMLTCDNRGTDLASAVFDNLIKQNALQRGFSEPEATQQSLRIVDHDRYRAMRVAQWVGLSSPVDPLSDLWIPIATVI